MCVRGVGWAGPSVCMCREGIKKRGMRLGELAAHEGRVPRTALHEAGGTPTRP